MKAVQWNENVKVGQGVQYFENTGTNQTVCTVLPARTGSTARDLPDGRTVVKLKGYRKEISIQDLHVT